MKGGTASDEQLVESVRRGDQGAPETLLSRHFDRIYGTCRRIAGNDADAADATQEAMIAIVKGLPGYDGRAKFTTWAYRVATNASLDELRRRNRRPQLGLPDHESADFESGGGSLEDGVADRLDVDAALAELPADYRVAVVLRDHMDMEYAQIAEVLGAPLGTVQSRIHRGRTMLSRVLGNNSRHSTHPRGYVDD